MVGAERTEFLELGLAGGERDDAAPEELGELNRKEGDAARTQGEHGLAGDHRLRPHERIPGGDPGAGQSGRLLPREVCRDLHGPLLVEEGMLSEHAVEGAAELVDDVPLHHAVAPVREVAAGHSVAHRESRDRIARGHHLAGAVAERDHAAPGRERIRPREDEGVALVQRRRVDTDQDLRGARLGLVTLAQDDAIEASDLVELICTHGLSIEGA
jgi:hypothetical protein